MKLSSITKEKAFETLLVIAAGLIFFAFVAWRRDYFNHWYLIGAAFGVMVLGLMFKSIAVYITFGWYKLAEGMGFIMQRVLLGLVFYLFLFPIALISRLGGKDSLKLKKREESYYDVRDHTYTAKEMDNIW